MYTQFKSSITVLVQFKAGIASGGNSVSNIEPHRGSHFLRTGPNDNKSVPFTQITFTNRSESIANTNVTYKEFTFSPDAIRFDSLVSPVLEQE